MSLPELCIKRPVFTIVMSLLLIIVGIIGFNQLSVRNLPEINKPVVSIQTDYAGASPKLIENSVTMPIENAVATVNGLDVSNSDSQMGESDIHLQFKLGTDIDVAVADVRNQVASIVKKLPKEASAPVVKKADPDAQATLIVSFQDPDKNRMALADYLQRYVVQTLEQVDGVSFVRVWGAGNYAMRIWLDPTAMAARSISATDVISALTEQNVNIVAGEIKSVDRNYTITATSQLSTPEQFSNIIISKKNGTIVRLKDIAKVKVGTNNPDETLRVDQKDSVGIGVVPDVTANSIVVSREALKKLAQLAPNFPTGMTYAPIFDRSQYINASIHDVYESLIAAIILVLLVVYAFLGSVRSALVPIVTIPVCLMATFGLLQLLGYSINTVTLLAMVLSIGLVVDDAIVVLENIFRHMEEGMGRLSASLKGSREIMFAIIAMTITLAAVYAPTAFIHGITGQIFQPFAITLAGAVLISGFVALTLTPMMCSHFLSEKKELTGYALKVNVFFDKVRARYQQLLRKALAQRMKVFGLVLVLALLGVLLFKCLPSELAPTEDEGAIVGIITAPNDASLAYTDRYIKQVENLYAKVPEVTHYLVHAGSPDNQAFSIAILKPWDKRHRSQADITHVLAPMMNNIPGVNAFPVVPAPLGLKTQGQHGLQMMVMTTGSYDDLFDTAVNIDTALSKYPGLTRVDHEMKMDSDQFNMDIDRNAAAQSNVSMSDIAQTMSVMLGGNQQTSFDYDGQNYSVIAQMKNMSSPQGLNQLYVRNSLNQMIPLSSLVSLTDKAQPLDLRHYDRQRADVITAELAPGYSVGQVVSYLNKVMPTLLPQSTEFAYTGAVKEYLESSGRMALVFLLSIVFIYLVLSAQFESFVDPVVVMVSVPLCIVGALFVLFVTGNSLNIYSNIGLVTLVGLIAKHGILITEFANQLQAQGQSKMEAIVNAASMRLRPILMTTSAMVLGAIPLALASGAGAAARHQVGWVIVGGMLFGTFFSLFVVPAAYTVLGRQSPSLRGAEGDVAIHRK